ncbi:UDENN FLCN/SMCR8-type domain-containing protein [Caenorhabditis elegans]|uniref:UDENN FLCN/SMCR8-type domain-containing protein n=1 Tax=Caenorhabditis elegans TaxID=6239 RepID=S6EZM3_CAEEL|nr:UDENN FLCN/SMCR8-type domain-containing protein [Caenorhabditis elegans]CDG24098.1 UDENN FLCN/SMCR8-type domain-containing protein [Caenorhabditis elegans]|eukprot:NP_001293479.1 FoLliCuliN [Caenorhabditis elegans]
MQAVIALCHFCENHGPRVVMTCQPMRDVDDKGASCTASTSLGPSTSSSPPGIIVPLIKFDGECVVKEKTNTEDGTSYPHYGNCTKFTIDTEDRCSACSSFRNGPCLLSNDHQTKTSYISSEVALQDRVYERVKNACLRSLSCEVSAASKKNPVQPPPPPLSRSTTPRKIHPYVIHEEPLHDFSGTRIPPSSTVLQEPIEDGAFEQPAAEEADGYVIFGDTDNGFCFAYIFRLADAKARGFYRLFSLIVVSNDLTFLTNNFEYFKTTLGGIKNDLQKLAQDVFSREIDTGEKLSEDDIHKPEFQKLVGKMPSWYRRKIAIDTDRNLTVVTANNDIWVQLHSDTRISLFSLPYSYSTPIIDEQRTRTWTA